MSAVPSFSALLSGMKNSARSEVFMLYASNVGLIVNAWISSYQRYMPGAVMPTTSVAVTGATPGAMINIPLTNTKQMWLSELEFAATGPALNIRFSAVLYDRLVHGTGLVANVAGEQSTGLPTAALPRYTNGEGVLPFLEVYGNMSTVNSTFTVTYTNQDGVAGRVSKPVLIVTNQNNTSDSIIPIMLQSGDTGCRSVESFNLATAALGTPGLGITLMKKLATMPGDTGSYVDRQGYRQLQFSGSLVEVMPGAFLQINWYPSTTTTGNWAIMGRFGIVES